MESIETLQQTLAAGTFKNQMDKLFETYREKINEASSHLKEKIIKNKENQKKKKKSVIMDEPIATHKKATSLFSDFSYGNDPNNPMRINNGTEQNVKNSYNLCEWESSKVDGFKNAEMIHKYYHELFTMKKLQKRSNGSDYDLKKDQKQILMKLFHELKDTENYVPFGALSHFFSQCKLFYLCYNIKPSQLDNILKESAHERLDSLSQTQFFNFFYVDRPNITGYDEKEQFNVMKKCILSDQSWKDLRSMFQTLDTFGDETVHLKTFIYKVKNNFSNRALINEAAIEYPEINRTISVKKVIFNIEHRSMISDKIRWKDIEQIFNNFQPKYDPTIDQLYQRMIERGQITKLTNNFMITSTILEEIKNIYFRCPKHCEVFIKTEFICRQFLESNLLKDHLKQAIVRIVTEGNVPKPIRLQDQIRILLQQAQRYIDLDELLEYFSIKGPINTRPETVREWESEISNDEEDEERLRELSRMKSAQKIKTLYVSKKHNFKQVRHLTVCSEFKLSKSKAEAIMARKTKEMKRQKDLEDQKELKNKFKANPIPAEINIEKYKQFVKKMEEEKELKRELLRKKNKEDNQIYQYLKTNTQIFNKKEKQRTEPESKKIQLTSKPIPWFVGQVHMLDKINQEKQLRRKVITAQSKKNLMRCWKDLPSAAIDTSQFTEQTIDLSNPRENPHQRHFRPKQVPNFKQLQRQFTESLEKRKAEWRPTEPIQFNLSCHKSPPKKVDSLQRKSKQTLKRKASLPAFFSNEKVSIPTTLKQEQMANFKRQKLNEKVEQKERELITEKNRIEKQKNFAKFMRRKLNQTLRKSHSANSASKTKAKQQAWKNLKKKNEEQLCRIYFNVMSRPFLFQTKKTETQGYKKTSGFTIPLKKKAIKNKPSHQTSKHIHQSPLKAIDTENHDETGKEDSPEQEYLESEDEFPQNYLNQSF